MAERLVSSWCKRKALGRKYDSALTAEIIWGSFSGLSVLKLILEMETAYVIYLLIALTSFSLFQELCDWEAASSSDQDRQPLLRNCQVRPLDPYHWLYCYLPNNSHRWWTWPIICGIEWNAIIVLFSVTVLGRMLTCRMCVYSVFGFAYCLRFVLMFMKPN